MKFAGEPGRKVPEFFRAEFDIDVSEDTVERAFKGLRAKNTRKRPRGRATGPGEPQRDESAVAVWTDWLRVDEQRLGVRSVLVRIPNDGFELPGLVDYLESLPGIRQVIETKETREVLAVGLLRTEDDEERLRARILEFLPGRAVSVSVIRTESHMPTALTWLHLAKEEAAALRQSGG